MKSRRKVRGDPSCGRAGADVHKKYVGEQMAQSTKIELRFRLGITAYF
jgi:hypothetical protein